MRILIADHDSVLLERVARGLGAPFEVDTVTNKADCLMLAGKGDVAMVIACEKVADGSGLDLLSKLQRRHPQILRVFAADADRLALLGAHLEPFQLFDTIGYPLDPGELTNTLFVAMAADSAHADTATIQHIVLSAEDTPPAPAPRARRTAAAHGSPAAAAPAPTPEIIEQPVVDQANLPRAVLITRDTACLDAARTACNDRGLQLWPNSDPGVALRTAAARPTQFMMIDIASTRAERGELVAAIAKQLPNADVILIGRREDSAFAEACIARGLAKRWIAKPFTAASVRLAIDNLASGNARQTPEEIANSNLVRQGASATPVAPKATPSPAASTATTATASTTIDFADEMRNVLAQSATPDTPAQRPLPVNWRATARPATPARKSTWPRWLAALLVGVAIIAYLGTRGKPAAPPPASRAETAAAPQAPSPEIVPQNEQSVPAGSSVPSEQADVTASEAPSPAPSNALPPQTAAMNTDSQFGAPQPQDGTRPASAASAREAADDRAPAPITRGTTANAAPRPRETAIATDAASAQQPDRSPAPPTTPPSQGNVNTASANAASTAPASTGSAAGTNQPPQDDARRAPTPDDSQSGPSDGGPKRVALSSLTPLNGIEVRYPRSALRAGTEGYVDVEFTVEFNGAVSDAVALAAEPSGTFDRAAVQAVRQLRFKPVREGGASIRVRSQLRVQFKLDK
ncbi:MAG: TonB family protein [Steroidobacteraceae bacterium]